MWKPISLMLFTAALLAVAAPPYQVTARYPVPGTNTGSWDYVTLDAAARRLYLSHATVVDVLDADSGKVVGQIADTPGVHGIAIAPEFQHGFTTNGREHKVSMFNPDTLALIRKIDVGKGPDGIYYDAASKRIFTCNHGSLDITAIDAKTGDVIGTVKVAGAGEQMITGRDGLLYVNLEDTAEVAAFDPQSLEVKHRFPITAAKVATGLAYDAKTNRLYVMCRNPAKMVVMNASSGEVISSFPIGAGVDWAFFDADTKLVFASCGDGTLNVFQQKSADKYEENGSIKTQPGAKTMAFDPKTRKIFLPTASFDMVAGEPGKAPQRVIQPNTFTVLVVSR